MYNIFFLWNLKYQILYVKKYPILYIFVSIVHLNYIYKTDIWRHTCKYEHKLNTLAIIDWIVIVMQYMKIIPKIKMISWDLKMQYNKYW